MRTDMRTVDLPVGTLCLLCDCTGQSTTAAIVDNDLGPVCSECFKHCQWATLELLWQAAAVSPSKE
jgi:hypothetical protein